MIETIRGRHITSKPNLRRRYNRLTIAARIMITMLAVPVLYCLVMQWKLKHGIEDAKFAEDAGSKND